MRGARGRPARDSYRSTGRIVAARAGCFDLSACPRTSNRESGFDFDVRLHWRRSGRHRAAGGALMADPDVDVVVVGAGVAGLAAASQLRARGRSCALLEAADRIGGRAWTTHPAALGGKPFDHGASWLHTAE